jgi:hypothetical protein
MVPYLPAIGLVTWASPTLMFKFLRDLLGRHYSPFFHLNKP